MQFRNVSTALSSFVHGGESAQTYVPAICPPPLPPSGPQNAVVPVCPSVAMQQSYLSRQQEQFLVENGVNPGASLPSGSFQNCSFTFNINITNSHDWLGSRTVFFFDLAGLISINWAVERLVLWLLGLVSFMHLLVCTHEREWRVYLCVSGTWYCARKGCSRAGFLESFSIKSFKSMSLFYFIFFE